MAFTINRQPTTYSTAFNELTFDVDSTQYIQDNYRYIFKLYINGNYITTSKLSARPTYNCLFDVQPYLKNFVQGIYFDEPNTYLTAQDGYVAEFYVEFYEEYLVGGVLTESAILGTSDTITCFEMVADRYEDSILSFIEKHSPSVTATTIMDESLSTYSGPRLVPTLSYSTDNSKSITSKDSYLIGWDDDRTLSIITRNVDMDKYVRFMKIRTYTNDGRVKQFSYLLPNVSTNTGPEYTIFHLPIGVNQLNTWGASSSVIPTGLTNAITQGEDLAYAVELFTLYGEEAEFTYYAYKPIVLRLVDCFHYDHCVLQYKTPIGGWWYINCDMKNYYSETNSRSTIQIKKQYNDLATFRDSRVINMDGVGKWLVNTDWLPSQAHISEVQDLLRSPEVFLIKDNKNIPVTITTNEYTVNNIAQDKLTKYSFELEEAFNFKNIR